MDYGQVTMKGRHLSPNAGSSDPCSAGNGSLMRLAPVVMSYFDTPEKIDDYAAESSCATHAAAECIDACRLFARMLCRALSGAGKAEVLAAEPNFRGAPAVTAIARGEYQSKRLDDIRGSGYVVDSLEAALWCFQTTRSFSEAILLAANLGDDADTTAAVCGQVAGAHYGRSGIPAKWLKLLAGGDDIEQIANTLYRQSFSL